MGRPYFLVDNLLNQRIYPNHTLAVSSTAALKSVYSLASGRRNRTLSGWWASATNTDAHVTVTCDQVRGANLLWIDRDHNLDGETLAVRVSSDGFTTYEEVGSQVVPSVAIPHSSLTGGQIIRTNEGALLWWLGDRFDYEYRIWIPAMGVGLRPELAGAMIGQAWAPDFPPIKPVSRSEPVLLRDVARSPQSQSVGSEFGSYAEAGITMKLSGLAEEAEAMFHMDLFLGNGKPMVVVPDSDRAEEARLVIASPGAGSGFRSAEGWGWPQLTVRYEEVEPVLR